MAKGNALGMVSNVENRDNPQPILIKNKFKTMSGKKIELSRYISDLYLDMQDESFVRWVEYEGFKTKYMVTRNGDVISVRKSTNKYLKHKIDEDGYHRVTLRINGTPHLLGVHKLVATAFIENPENKDQANHMNGNKNDNTVENLEWTTCKENINHAWKTGLAKAKHAEEHPNSVYTNEQINAVCEHLVKNKNTMKEISQLTKVTYTVVKQIRNHVIWNTISKNYDFSNYNVSGRSKHKETKIMKNTTKPTNSTSK